MLITGLPSSENCDSISDGSALSIQTLSLEHEAAIILVADNPITPLANKSFFICFLFILSYISL